MERRELLKIIAVLTGGVVIGGEVFLSGCKNTTGSKIVFTKETIALLDEIGETILPKTKTPGAKDAAIGKFMQTIVTDCYYPADQKIFMNGIDEITKQCKEKYSKDFLQCDAEQRTELIKKIDAEAKEHNNKKFAYDAEKNNKLKGTLEYNKELMPSHWFSMVKQLTMWGFFTSEVGASQALRYVPVPGRYDGDVPYKKGDRSLFPCY
jgi:Gluconate 2-dehydrogenase subunit 3